MVVNEKLIIAAVAIRGEDIGHVDDPFLAGASEGEVRRGEVIPPLGFHVGTLGHAGLRDAGGSVDEGIDGYPLIVRNFPMGERVFVGIVGFVIPDAEGNGVVVLDSFGDMVKEFVGFLDGISDGETVVALYGGV